MNKRLEYKYFVPNEYLNSLRSDMLKYLQYDRFALTQPNKEYIVRSIYLDTVNFKTFFDKSDGLEERCKYRIRGYNTLEEESIVFLELKRRHNDFISKDRARLFYRDLNALLQSKDITRYIHSGTSGDIYKKGAMNFLYYYYGQRLTPAFLVVYNREAFECKFGSQLRITFDKFVRSMPSFSLDTLFCDNGYKYEWPGYFVLEVKFHMVIPDWVPRLITKYDLQRISASKYATCFEVHRGIKKYNRQFAM